MSKLWEGRIVLEIRHLFTGFHNLETVANRSRERYRRIAATIGAGVLSKGVAAVVSLLTIPLTIGYLGTQRYGLWMTISSLISVLGFAEIGLSSSLLNVVSHGCGRADGVGVRRQVSSAFVLYLSICLVMSLSVLLGYRLVPWARVFNVTDVTASSEAAPAVVVFILCYAFGLPAGVVQVVQAGLQEGFASNLWQAGGSMVTLVCLVLSTKAGLGLPWLVLVFTGAPVLVKFANTFVYFRRVHPELAPSVKLCDLATMRRLMSVGAGFLVLQIQFLQGVTIDTFLVSHGKGASAVSEYAVVARAFGIVSLVVSLVLTPFWAAYGEAFSRGDFAWLRIGLRRSLVFVGVFSMCGSAVLVVVGRQLVAFWSRQLITPSLALLVAFAVYTIANTAFFPSNYILMGTGNLKFTLISFGLMLPVSVLARHAALQFWGLAGMVAAAAVCQLLFVTAPAFLYVPRYLRRAELRRVQSSETEALLVTS